MIRVNKNYKKRIIVLDDFLENPYEVREFALRQNFIEDTRYYKGKRSEYAYLSNETREAFEESLGQKIVNWSNYEMNGRFQYCTPEDRLVYHADAQRWAAVYYLTPDAPFSTGTSFFASKRGKCRNLDECNSEEPVFSGGFYDSTKFELVDVVGNVFNRVVIFDARCIHAASLYFGTNVNDSRLFQIFFFD